MPPFVYTGAFAWTVVTLVAAIAAWFIGAVDVKFHGGRRQARAAGTRYALVVLVVFTAIASLGSYLVGADHGPSKAYQAANDQVAAELFGFESGKTYPLDLGGQVTSVTATVEAGGFFSSAATATVNGGPAVTATYVHNNQGYPLTLPRDMVTFEFDEVNEPQMTVRLRQGLYTTEANYDRIWSDCTFVIANLAPACQRVATLNEHVTVKQSVIDQGLGAIVSVTFESARLRMPRAMYDQLIGDIPAPR